MSTRTDDSTVPEAPARRVAKRVVFASVTILLVLGTLEGGTQLMYRLSTGQWLSQWWGVPIYESDPYRVYRVKSNLHYVHKTSEFWATYITDDNGFRTRDSRSNVTYEKTEGVFRLMYLGPSFTFGWAADYEDCYATRISDNLNIPGKKIEIVNVGTPAQPVNYQLAWLKKEGFRFAPDMIVQTVFGSCDTSLSVDGKLPERVPLVEGGYLCPPPAQTWKERATGKVRRWRQISTLAFYSWRAYALISAIEEPTGPGRELYEEGHFSGDWDGEMLQRYREYQEFVRHALGRDVPVVFLYVPDAHVVRPADLVRVKQRSSFTDPATERAKARKADELLNRHGIHFVDLTGPLITNDKNTRMYHLYDTHFTKAGNQVAAETAIPEIQRVIDSEWPAHVGGHTDDRPSSFN